MSGVSVKADLQLQTTQELLEAITAQDQLRLCQWYFSKIETTAFPHWIFLRWAPQQDHLVSVFPSPSNKRIAASGFQSQQIDLDKAWIEEDSEQLAILKEAFPEIDRFPRALAIPIHYDSEFYGILLGFTFENQAVSLEHGEELREYLTSFVWAWYLVRVQEERDKLAFVDSLTGLYNSHYLISFLQNEVSYCDRHSHSTAVLFVDIDWFKNVNDAYGHLVGSQILKDLGDFLHTRLRDSDVVTRYGGDEFVVVLREADLDLATQIAERLRISIAEARFAEQLEEPIQITVSVGISVYPQHGKDAVELIHHADLAMYRAKHNEKNCVRIAV